MRVLLISANREDINMVTLPLGLALVAASVQSSGHEVELVDLMRADDVRGRIKSAIRRFEPEAIGISVRNIDDQNMARPRFLLEQVREVVEICREQSEAPLILGGAGYSIFPQAALEYLGADMGLQGEGEWAFPELLQRLKAKEDPGDLPGLFLPGRGNKTKRRYPRHLNDLPWSEAARWLRSAPKGPESMVPVQTRRGCPMNCSYCSTPLIEGGVIRKCLPEKAAKAVASYMEAGLDRLFVTDNTFNLPPSYAKDFCRVLISQGLQPDWRCIVHPGQLDEELVEFMARAGCTEVSLGFESGSDRILRRLNKRFTREDVLRDRRLLAKVGLKVMGFLMLGVPGETKDSVKESLEFADLLAPDLLRLTVGVRIYPHTLLAEHAVRRGLVAPEDDLLRPSFYLEPELRDWLPVAAENWAAERPRCLTG